MASELCFSVIKPYNLIHLRKKIESVWNYHNNTVWYHLTKIFKYLLLCILIQCRKWVIKNNNRLFMADGSCKCKTLCLTTRKTHPTASNKRINAIFHKCNFLIKAHHFKVIIDISVIAHKNIIPDRIVKKFTIMTKICNYSVFRTVNTFHLFPGKLDASTVRILTQKYFSKCWLTTGNGTGYTNNFTRCRRKWDSVKYYFAVRIWKSHIADFKFSCIICFSVTIVVFHTHKRFDTFPWNLCFMYCIKKFCCTWRLYRKLCKARYKCCKCCYAPCTPACAEYISATEIQYKYYTRHWYDSVHRCERRIPNISFYCWFFISCKTFLISIASLLLSSKHPVCYGIRCNIKRRSA